MAKSKKLTKIQASAKGEECTIRIPGAGNHDPSTTVLCHLGGGGLALKHDDIHAAYGCYDCHLIVDGAPSQWTRDEVKLMFYDGMVRTQLILIEKGLIKRAEK